jgi:hypothetical protein
MNGDDALAPLRRKFTIAGRPVHLRVAGDELAGAMLNPFAHLPAAPELAPAELTILAVDRSRHEGPPSEMISNGRVWDCDSHRVTTSLDGRFIRHVIVSSGSNWTLDRLNHRITGLIQASHRLTLYERGKTFQLLLPFWLESQGLDLVHAALIASKGTGVLIAGPNGAGKSTVALSCVMHGFDYLGDDYIALEDAPQASIGHSIYGCAFLDPTHLRRFPALVPHAIGGLYSDEPKRLALLNRIYPSRMAASATLRFLLLPRVGPGPTAIRKANKAEALRQLAPSSLLMLARPEPAAMIRFARLVNKLECFWLDSGPNLEEIPRLIAGLLG